MNRRTFLLLPAAALAVAARIRAAIAGSTAVATRPPGAVLFVELAAPGGCFLSMEFESGPMSHAFIHPSEDRRRHALPLPRGASVKRVSMWAPRYSEPWTLWSITVEGAKIPDLVAWHFDQRWSPRELANDHGENHDASCR